MKLPTLLDEIKQAVEADDSSANSHIVLAQQASDLADMVGWAPGPIDPRQQVYVRLEALIESLRERHGRTGEVSIAALHDALIELHRGIDRHDRDLDTRREADDEDGV